VNDRDTGYWDGGICREVLLFIEMYVVGEKTRVLFCDKIVDGLTRSCCGVENTNQMATLTDQGLAENDFICTFTTINERACCKLRTHSADALAHINNTHIP